MTVRGRRLLWAVIGAGLAVRLVVAFTTYGVAFDIDSYSLVRGGLATDPLHVYGDFDRWPYPPGYFVWIRLASWTEGVTGLAFHDLVQVPPILADLALAPIVAHVLGKRGAGEGTRIAAAALVALGPAFVVISGYHGQIDSLAILPAVLGVLLWSGSDHPRRAVAAGLLIGVGAAVKTVPLVAVLALLPSMRSRREGLVLIASAGALPVLAFLPFALADPDGVGLAVSYRGVPGVGGISLLAQPELARVWMNEASVAPSWLTTALLDYGGAITAIALLAVAAFLLRFRPSPIEGAALVYLALWAFGINFFLQYVIWGLPFLLMAGYVRAVALAQVLMLPAIVLVYLRPWESVGAAWVYAFTAIGLWLASVIGFVLLARRIAHRGALTASPGDGSSRASPRAGRPSPR